MSQASATPRGRLRVDVGTSLARLLIIPNLAGFQARYPDIQLDLGVSDRIIDLVGDNVDCVIRGGELSDQSLVARRIGNMQLITVASPDYLRRHGTPDHPLDIEKSHDIVSYFSPVTGRKYPLEFHQGEESLEVMGAHVLGINESNAYVSAVVAGMGIGQVGTFQALEPLARGELVQVLPQWSHPLIPLYVVYPPNRHLSAKVRAFVDWVADLFASQPHIQRSTADLHR